MSRRQSGWRPLGWLLVSKGLITEAELRQALAEQQGSGRRLGEILVAHGYISSGVLASALREQQALAEQSDQSLEAGSGRARERSATGEPYYEVRHILYESAHFLEAIDFAFEFLDEHEEARLEVVRMKGDECETVWTYDKARTGGAAQSRKDLVELFGFDVVGWRASPAVPQWLRRRDVRVTPEGQ